MSSRRAFKGGTSIGRCREASRERYPMYGLRSRGLMQARTSHSALCGPDRSVAGAQHSPELGWRRVPVPGGVVQLVQVKCHRRDFVVVGRGRRQDP